MPLTRGSDSGRATRKESNHFWFADTRHTIRERDGATEDLSYPFVPRGTTRRWPFPCRGAT